MKNRIAQTAEARAVNSQDRTIDVVASTFALDSFNTRIDPEGWDLEQFRKNPVITWAHDDRGVTASGGRPIAKAENIRPEDGKLKMRLRFPKPGSFAFADEVFNLMADGFLNAVSVGFEPVEWRDETTEEEGGVRVFTKQKLLEVAVVTIPSNDDALAERAKRMNADLEEVRQRAQKVEELAKEIEEEPVEVRNIDDVVESLPEGSLKEDLQKRWSYFEAKQPANKASVKVLERFFKQRGEKQPDDEVEAWQRMQEIMEAETEEPTKVPVEPEETEEVNGTEETEIEVEVNVEKEEEPTEQPTAQEAPEPERKASVHVPLSVLRSLPGAFMESAWKAAVEASRQGVSVSDLAGVVEHMGNSVQSSFIPHERNNKGADSRANPEASG